MTRLIVLVAIVALLFGLTSVLAVKSEAGLSVSRHVIADGADTAVLRTVYSGPPARWPAPDLAAGVALREIGPLPEAPEPQVELAALGTRLFFDTILSEDRTLSCSSCHDPAHGFAQSTKVATGVRGQMGRRNAPGLHNVAHTAPYFWDGRADTLEEQALGPIQDPTEMAATREMVERRLNDDTTWRAAFREALGVERIRLEDVGTAIAAYERTLDRPSRFDAFMQGDHDALSDQELRGLHLFRTKARCMTCHNGPEFTDGQAHNIGLTYYGRKYEDLGVYARTGKPEDVGRFHTPSLRLVSQTAPYMHNGLFPSLRGIVNIYDAGGVHPRRREAFADDPLFPETSDKLLKLHLTPEEKDALVAFLETL